jgi:hypothetical protein
MPDRHRTPEPEQIDLDDLARPVDGALEGPRRGQIRRGSHQQGQADQAPRLRTAQLPRPPRPRAPSMRLNRTTRRHPARSTRTEFSTGRGGGFFTRRAQCLNLAAASCSSRADGFLRRIRGFRQPRSRPSDLLAARGVSCRPGPEGRPAAATLRTSPKGQVPGSGPGHPTTPAATPPRSLSDRGQTAIPTPPGSQARTPSRAARTP